MYSLLTTFSSNERIGVEPVVSNVSSSVVTPLSLLRETVIGFCSSSDLILFTASIEMFIFAVIPVFVVVLAFAVYSLPSASEAVYEEPGVPLALAMPAKVSESSGVRVTLSPSEPPSKVIINISTIPSLSSIGLVAQANPGITILSSAITLFETFTLRAFSLP